MMTKEKTENKEMNNRDARHAKFIKLLFDQCNFAGYQIEGRIVLRDRVTGKVYE